MTWVFFPRRNWRLQTERRPKMWHRMWRDLVGGFFWNMTGVFFHSVGNGTIIPSEDVKPPTRDRFTCFSFAGANKIGQSYPILHGALKNHNRPIGDGIVLYVHLPRIHYCCIWFALNVGIHTYTYIHVYIYIHIHVHIYIYTYKHIHIYIYTYTYIYIYIHTYIDTYTYIHIHIYIYMYIYINT